MLIMLAVYKEPWFFSHEQEEVHEWTLSAFEIGFPLTTFIQDSVLMMELRPCYPIWQHPIFSDPVYLSFERDMLQIEAQEHDPAHTLLQQCVPSL
ncbi:hypothetical protein [Absidia glauca]|uniref:Ndc10 domain-containing protein n=1 Tax=Absidia glauca TaxID=4829 RepID=A0A163KB95_ABSGL|nr:hypothetical protein [Absidia glauca]